MRYNILFLVASVGVIIAACSPSKKSVSTAADPGTSATVPAGPAGPALPAKSNNGVYAPGEEELTALRTKYKDFYKDVTLETLAQGHAIYTGVCTNCHKAYSIYNVDEFAWGPLIDNMAMRARITDVEKDAVYKYVMAIKAAEPK